MTFEDFETHIIRLGAALNQTSDADAALLSLIASVGDLARQLKNNDVVGVCRAIGSVLIAKIWLLETQPKSVRLSRVLPEVERYKHCDMDRNIGSHVRVMNHWILMGRDEWALYKLSMIAAHYNLTLTECLEAVTDERMSAVTT